MLDVDPFTQVHRAIAKAILADARVAEQVKANNVVTWDNTRGPIKERLTTADLPELQLRAGTLAVNLGSKSCGTELTRAYSLVLNTGEQQLSVNLYPLEWALIGVAYRLKFEYLLSGLLYKKRSFVTDCNIVSAEAGLSSADDNRGITGWTALWTLEVQMNFSELI
jgi:hypothetical protein